MNNKWFNMLISSSPPLHQPATAATVTTATTPCTRPDRRKLFDIFLFRLRLYFSQHERSRTYGVI